MKNIAFINKIELNAPLLETSFQGKNVSERVEEFALSLPDVKEVIAIEENSLENDSIASLISFIEKNREEYDNFFYFFGDTPFLDSSLSKKMYENHGEYLASYTFADGYPYGLSPEIMRFDILNQFKPLLNNEKAETILATERDAFFKLLSLDINSFDIETYLAQEDNRLMRISLTADTKRETEQLLRLSKKEIPTSDNISQLIRENPETFRTFPAFLNLQITGNCPQNCSYCPQGEVSLIPKNNKELPYSKVVSLMDEARSLSFDITVGFSLWGESSLHSEIYAILKKALTTEGVTPLVETSGLGWNYEEIENLIKETGQSPLWIISLDALNEEAYQSLRGEGFKEAHAFAKKMLALAPEKTYVQLVRMKENELESELFYRSFSEITENIIIQKYDNFSKILPEKKMVDLSPINRTPCWHLKRTLSVLVDGSVPLCREDLKQDFTLGNVFEDSLATLWERGKEYYLKDVKKEFSPLCEKCDEYYCFNF